MEYYTAIRKDEILQFAARRMETEGIRLGKQVREEDKNGVSSLI